MRDTHATLEDLAGLLAGEPSVRVADHLFGCCSCWRQACEVLHQVNVEKLSSALKENLSAREPRRWALLERFRLEEARLEAALGAQAAIAKIRGLKRKQRKEYVAKSKIFHNSACVQALLEEARVANVPYDGEEWADLSIVACYQVVSGLTELERHDLLAECYSELAGARRRSARWQPAREAVRQGREHYSKGAGSFLAEGHLSMVDGCIEGDLGELAKAEGLLEGAAASFLKAGAPRLAAKAIIQIAYVVLDIAPERTVLVRRLPNIVAFVNSQTPLRKVGNQIVVDPQIRLLFGVPPSGESLRRKEVYRKDIPNDDVRFTQFFASSDYPALAQGLWAANSAGRPAMFTQTLTTVPNANFGVEKYTVRVLWVYNTYVTGWHALLGDAMKLLVDATFNFPNYDTVLQLNLSATEVNLLAHLSCWNVTTNAAMVRALFNG